MLRRYLSALLSLILVVTSVPGAARAELTDGSTALATRGSTGAANGAGLDGKASSDPFSGAATSEFPISVPPGTAGMEPSIALSYSSQRRADSWVGYGWGLGFGGIRRSLKKGIPSYDDARDVFELDGQELIPDPQIPNRFHTRRESFQRIDRLPGGGWEVRATNGVVSRYGVDPAARVADGARIFEWLFHEMEDLDSNLLRVEYTDGGDPGTKYPSRVVYTLIRRDGFVISFNPFNPPSADRTVEFQLEARPDPVQSRIRGFLSVERQRLARIFVKSGGALVRRYDLRYRLSPDGPRSLLESITERGSDAGIAAAPIANVRSRPTTYTYSSNVTAGTQGYQTTPWSVPSGANFVVGAGLDGGTQLSDVNGDALPDLLVARLDVNFTPTPESGVYLNTGSGFETTKSSRFPVPPELSLTFQAPTSLTPGAPTMPFPAGTLLLDLNGDGRAELLRSLTQYAPVANPAPGEFPVGVVPNQKYAANTGNGWNIVIDSAQGQFLSDARFSTGAFAPLNLPAVFEGASNVLELNGDGRPDLLLSEFGQIPTQGLFAPLLGAAFNLGNNTGFSAPVIGNFLTCGPGEETVDGPCFANTFTSVKMYQLSGPNVVVTDTMRLGVRFIDLNSDGLDDQVRSLDTNVFDVDGDRLGDRQTFKSSFINSGVDFVRDDGWNIPPLLDSRIVTITGPGTATPRPTRDQGVRFIDVNGDGKIDTVRSVAPTGPRGVWLNSGSPVPGNPGRPWIGQPGTSPLQIPAGFEFVEANGGIDRGVRAADLDGNGMVDLIQLREGSPPQVMLNRGSVPDQLISITGPLGGRTEFEYTSSARMDNTGEDDLPDLPQPTQVVSAMVMNDLVNPPVRTTFSYADGMFDAADREFRGFGMVEAKRAADGRATRMFFLQDVGRAGLMRRMMVLDASGHELSNTFMNYTADAVAGPPFIHLPESVFTTEAPRRGSPAPALTTVTSMSYEVDGAGVIQFGRVVAMTEFGEIGAGLADLNPLDTRTTEFEYVPANTDVYLVNLVKAQRVRQGATFGVGPIVRETLSSYDEDLPDGAPRRGRLTSMTAVLGEMGQKDAKTTFTYDEFGNVKTVVSPRANAEQGGGTMTVDYDVLLRTFPVAVTNAAGHVTRYDYAPDPAVCPNGPRGSGLVYAVQGANDTSTSRAVRCYDALGRVTLQRAADNLAQVTSSYVDTPGGASMNMSQRVNGSNTRDATMFLDGFGRGTGTVTDGPVGRPRIVTTTNLDAAGRKALERDPFYFGDEVPQTVTLYDERDRAVEITRPSPPTGGASEPGERRETNVYDPTMMTSTDANQNVKRTTMDAFGNVIKVEEFEGNETFTTTYDYDILGNLRKIRDHEGNETSIDYDRLGRRKRIVDPDTGERTFRYDVEGNLLEETSAAGTMRFEYDVLGRTKRRVAGSEEELTSYDGPAVPKGIGFVERVREFSNGVERSRRDSLGYDALGRETGSRRSIDGFSFAFSTTFDALGQDRQRTLPNGKVLVRTYDAKGYLTDLALGGTTQVSGIQFAADGRLASWTGQNGVRTTTERETRTQRVREVRVESGSTSSPTLLDGRRYGFDPGDRVKTINDLVTASRDQSFMYDRLNRLKRADGPYAAGLARTSLFYKYSAIGNLTCLDSTVEGTCTGGRSMVYPTAGNARPHAPRTVNGQLVQYTPSGSLSEIGTRRYAYDALDRLTSVQDAGKVLQSIVYTSAGDRLRVDDLSGRRTMTKYILSEGFEFDATLQLARAHLTVNGSVVGTVTEPYEPAQSFAALPPASMSPIDVGSAAAEALAALGLLALLLQLALLRRRGVALPRPALAGSAVLVFWIAAVPAPLWAAPLDGDLNADGKLDAADAMLAMRIAQGFDASQAQKVSGDVAPFNQAPRPSPAIDLGDAMLILRGTQENDVDGDGFPTQLELAFGSSPFRADIDADGVNDLQEAAQGSDPRSSDSDLDGLSDLAERNAKTDPNDPDTDGDGTPDATDTLPRNGIVFLHQDALGSTTLVTGATGSVIRRVAYRPFGGTVPGAPPNSGTPVFGFTQQRFDAKVGLYDFQARVYDPMLGRFLQADAFVGDTFNPQTLNRYSYVENNPLNRTDPTGNFSLGGALGAIGGGLRGIGGAIGRGFGAIGRGLGALGSGIVAGAGFGLSSLLRGADLAARASTAALRAGRDLGFAAVKRVLNPFPDPELIDVATEKTATSAEASKLGKNGIFTNGIFTSRDRAIVLAREAFDRAGIKNGLLIYNPTGGLFGPLSDLVESGLQLFLPGVTDLDRFSAGVINWAGSVPYARGFSQGSLTLRNGVLLSGLGGSGRVQEAVLSGSPSPFLFSQALAGPFTNLTVNPGSLGTRFFDPVYALGNPVALPTGFGAAILGCATGSGCTGTHDDSLYNLR